MTMKWATVLTILSGIVVAMALAYFNNVRNDALICDKQMPLHIAIDVGHSRQRPGATSATGKPEYEFNDRFANELILAASSFEELALSKVTLNGRHIPLRQRTAMAKEIGAKVFLSIHHDSVNEKYLKYRMLDGKRRAYADNFRGHSLFVSRENPKFSDSKSIATAISQQLKAIGRHGTLHHAEAIKGENRELISRELAIYNAPFAVLVSASMPSVLFEVGVIIHPDEEFEMNDQNVRAKIIDAVLKGLTSYCRDAYRH